MEKEIIAVCPYVNCNKVLLRRVEVFSENEVEQKFMTVVYESLCQHCKRKVKVRIGLTAKAEPVF